ncbi:MAG: PTS sugar transporter subunit IIA [candidate division KSB1 bacterium]|nr:PTS sugar transporter subunit IIA [candidate division KSB1 bacterium]
MNLTDILSPDVIKIPLKGAEKNAVLEEMVDILHQAQKTDKRDDVLQAVQQRERIMSTGMGDGVAIPHAKSDGVETLTAALGITKQGVDFQAIDGKPVRIVFLLVGPNDQAGPHLKALSRISRLMHRKEFRQRLAKARNAEQILSAIEKEEQKHFSS